MKVGDWIRFPVRRRAFERLVKEKLIGFPWLADAWSDYIRLESEREAFTLATKKWPAPDAATKVREAGAKAAAAERRAKQAEYVRNLYEASFPWLTDLLDEDAEELFLAHAQTAELNEDPAQHWLTKEEYASLSTVAKFQLALDRYWQSRKSRWEIGRDYERYIGYLYEKTGFNVTYHGIAEGFDDLGRDLIAINGPRVEIVQCKYWSSSKTIHEKHIFQLFGTLTAYELDHPKVEPRGVFYTSTVLSERAKQFADRLGIEVHEEARLESYPCIKCNISRHGGQRIYHLPFDQQYDRTVIEEERLECYVSTVKEAEDLGFRRAHRWSGQPA